MKYYGKLLDPKDLTTKEYVDNTLSASLGYTDDKSAETLQAAKDYTDQHSGKIESITVNSGSVLPIIDKNVDIPITKSTVGLSNVDNKSEATIKSDLTGSITSGNTNFITGGDIYTALNNKQDIFQVTALPEPSSSIENKVYQFVGESNDSYTTSAFYKCIGTTMYNHAVEAAGTTYTGGYAYQISFNLIRPGSNQYTSYVQLSTALRSADYVEPNVLAATGTIDESGEIKTIYGINRSLDPALINFKDNSSNTIGQMSTTDNTIDDTVTAVTSYHWEQVIYNKSEIDAFLTNKADKSQLDDVIQTLMAYVDSKIGGAMDKEY